MIKYEENQLLVIWLESVGLNSYNLKQWLLQKTSGRKDIKKLLSDCREEVVSSVGAAAFDKLMGCANKDYLKSLLDGFEKRGIKCLTEFSEDYPRFLKQVESPPAVLYVKGDVSLLKNENLFAVVGSRRSLPQSLNYTENFVKEFVKKGIVPVTGIAEGVDATVLKTAISEGKPAVTVLASGIDNVSPVCNGKLVEEVAKSGLVITEHLPQVVAKPYFYPLRNRIIAGISKGVLVVSAHLRSGTAYTAGYAFEFGKDVFAVPYGIGVPSGEGCNELIKKGAYLADSPEDVLSFYGFSGEEKTKIELSPEEKSITESIADGCGHIEQICRRLNKEIFEITPFISLLEMKGVIVKTGFNLYGLTGNISEE